MQQVHSILKQYWGHDNFRPLQSEIINAVLEGNDTLALMPTGGGKSVCFQIPALAKEGICLVISPLIALIKDQVEQLKEKGINALAIYSGMSFIEVKKTLENAAYGNYKFLYVSPERLETTLFSAYLPALNINLIAVDEAHCISQWGYDFRPSYLKISNLRALLPKTPVIALTASATKNVQDDICEKLLFSGQAKKFQQTFARNNVSFSVFNVASKQVKLLTIINNVAGSGIVYCKSRKHTKEIADLLKLHKINAEFYHAGLNHDERNQRQENWIKNKTRVIVCTNAFGMGIDKPDVRFVIHFDVPDCLENYYQEAGRCGRDGKRSYAVLLYSEAELNLLKEQPQIRFPDEETLKQTYIALMNHLQLPAGSGEGLSFDFDLSVFARAFKMDVLSVSYCIKIFEQENILNYTENFFTFPTVVFSTDKNTLEEFIKNNPQHEDVVKGLLRSYEGVFDYPATINIANLANFIRLNVEDVKATLNILHQNGIISYNPQKNKPQLFMVQNRMYTDSYTLNTSGYFIRKEEFIKRIHAIINYINNKLICRGTAIANYFNDFTTPDCKICDNCIVKNQLPLSSSLFTEIADFVFSFKNENGINIKDLLTRLSGYKKHDLTDVINYLQKEEKIRIDHSGNITFYNNV